MKAWKYIPWILAAIVLALAIIQANGVQPVEASKLLTKVPTQTDNCLAADCPAIKGYVCTANDVTVTLVETYDVDDPCSYIGDTGKYVFLAQIVAGAQSRYDVSWWIALDGANAKTGASCYSDFIRPPLQSSGLSTTLPLYGPYWDLEYLDNGATDGCGDVVQDQYNYEQVGTLLAPVILNCTTDVMDGSINVCVAWDNQSNNNCNTTTGTEENGCPNTKSKCNCEDVPFELNLNEIDLSLTKDISTGFYTNEPFTYTMQVTNNSTITSTGFVISDTLDSRLQYISATPPLCTATGQAIRCNILQDLGPGDSYTLYLKVQVDPAYTGGEIIPNTACVIPFEDDTNPLNNCDDADVPTPVEMVSFTGTGWKNLIILNWETTSEMEIMGFKLYRSRLPLGIDRKLIFSTAAKQPGKALGDVYSYTDSNLKTDRSYTYWLEIVLKDGSVLMLEPTTVQLMKLKPSQSFWKP